MVADDYYYELKYVDKDTQVVYRFNDWDCKRTSGTG